MYRTYGALYISLPNWFIPTLQLYLSNVRPKLLDSPEIWGDTPSSNVFPRQVATFSKQLLSEAGVVLSCSDIRSRVCENIGQLTHGRLRTDLQYTAAHKSETTDTVVRL